MPKERDMRYIYARIVRSAGRKHGSGKDDNLIDTITENCSIDPPPDSDLHTEHSVSADLEKYYDYFICLENFFYDKNYWGWDTTVKRMVDSIQLKEGKNGDVYKLYDAIDAHRKIYAGPGGGSRFLKCLGSSCIDEFTQKENRVEDIEKNTISYLGGRSSAHEFLTFFAYHYYRRLDRKRPKTEYRSIGGNGWSGAGGTYKRKNTKRRNTKRKNTKRKNTKRRNTKRKNTKRRITKRRNTKRRNTKRR